MQKKRARLHDILGTFNLSLLLFLNLFLMMTFLLAIATVLVITGVDGGFLMVDGHPNLGGFLTILYAFCILITVSVVFMVRLIFIHPLQEMISAMRELANGNFSIRLDEHPWGYSPKEIREFRHCFNKAAHELGGTEILRKDFVNNFSHEFKTPIVSITGFADLLLEETLDEADRREYLTIIRDESKRLAELATHVLTLNRIESQSILTDKAPYSLDEQIRQSVLVTQQKWREKELHFEVQLASAVFCGSEALMKEVWLNLLDNAAKFSPDGATVSVTLRHEKNAFIASITDNGIGMNDETKAHIFEQFYQGDSSHATQGNGLGLAMVKKILELHNSSISVESQIGQGSCFSVTLPDSDSKK